MTPLGWGKLFRRKMRQGKRAAAVEWADFNHDTFGEIRSPASAVRW